MYNLIVTDRLEAGEATIDRRRAFEHTSGEITKEFFLNGEIDISKVKLLPSIFMKEGKSTELAYFANINSIKKSFGGDLKLKFTPYNFVNPFVNHLLLKNRGTLDIDDFEFSRNHWAIKEVDIFKVLSDIGVIPNQSNTLFKASPLNFNLIAMMMPFHSNFDAVYRKVGAALKADGYEVKRADDFWLNHQVMEDIIQLITSSRIIICDLSRKNPNVFYELGLAHALGKDVILITQNEEDVPFDLKQFRYIFYLNNGEGLEELVTKISARVETLVEND